MNTSTVLSKSIKPMGISKDEYKSLQATRAEEEFKYDTAQKLQNLKFLTEALQNSILSLEASHRAGVKNCEILVDNLNATFLESLREFRMMLDNTENMVKKHVKYSDICTQMTNTQGNAIEALDKKASHLVEACSSLFIEQLAMKDNFQSAIDRVKAGFEDQLKHLKEEILSIPSEIPAVKKEFQEKIEMVELNGQSAIVRSSNNERHLLMVDRKIDQLYQLYRKLDFDGKEAPCLKQE